MSKFAVKKRFFLAALVIFFFFLLAFICILHVEACHTAAFFLTSLVFFDPYLYSGCQKAFFLTSLVSSFKHLFAGCQSSPKTSVVSDKSC